MDPGPTASNVAPFASTYTPGFPELIHRLGGSLAVTTYQAGKILLLSAPSPDRLVQLPRTLEKPMGMAVHSDGKRLAIACKQNVQTFANAPELAANYPKNPGTYDALFLPRATYHTGPMDWHDLAWTDDGLLGVNTLFSCIARIDDSHHFTPVWTPPTVSEWVGEDRCHLNGLAVRDGEVAYATAFNRGNSAKSWRSELLGHGVLWDVKSNSPLATELSMPHSPRWYNGNLYVLQSALGSIGRVDVHTGTYQEILRVGSFVRGLALVDHIAFVGISKARTQSSSFAHLNLPVADRCGLLAVDLRSGEIVGEMTWHSSVDELFEVHWLSAGRRINLLTAATEDHHFGVTVPGASYWAASPTS
jgi:uncharacterized protein (TIGR03032 family)